MVSDSSKTTRNYRIAIAGLWQSEEPKLNGEDSEQTGDVDERQVHQEREGILICVNWKSQFGSNGDHLSESVGVIGF